MIDNPGLNEPAGPRPVTADDTPTEKTDLDKATIAIDLDTRVRAHMALATFEPIPGVDMFELAAVVAYLADLTPADREAVAHAAGRVARVLPAH